MSKRGSRRRFIRVVCTDMYIDRQSGLRCARHQQFRLGRLPVFVEKDQDGNALPGTEYVGYHPDAHVNQHMPARRCPKCGRPMPGPRDIPMRGVEPYRPALAGRQPQTLCACGGYLGPGLFLVAGCRKGAITQAPLVPTRTPKDPRYLSSRDRVNSERTGDSQVRLPLYVTTVS